MLLIAGGEQDPNLVRLFQTARARGAEVKTLTGGASLPPKVSFDPASCELFVDGQTCTPNGVFLRHDVFGDGSSANHHDRAMSWFSLVAGWLSLREEIVTFNRAANLSFTNKAAVLSKAVELGLSIPKSIVTNDCEQLEKFCEFEAIAKPLNGGGLCQKLEEVVSVTPTRSGCTAQPAIVQQRIPGPDLRIYGIDGQLFGFNLESDSLDYRERQDAKISECEISADVKKPLLALSEQLELDWFAADFKVPGDGKPVFLEINTNPMFVAFDSVAGGALTNAMVAHLCKH